MCEMATAEEVDAKITGPFQRVSAGELPEKMTSPAMSGSFPRTLSTLGPL